jgi:hypothetical protein
MNFSRVSHKQNSPALPAVCTYEVWRNHQIEDDIRGLVTR